MGTVSGKNQSPKSVVWLVVVVMMIVEKEGGQETQVLLLREGSLAMGFLSQHHLRFCSARVLITSLLFFAFASSSIARSHLSRIHQLGAAAGVVIREEREETKSWLQGWERFMTRRRLVGSSPPTCRFKCGRCSPCKAVHIPIQPDRRMPLEYYPEAWRCKCGNNYFLP